jgi:hypothetical protein
VWRLPPTTNRLLLVALASEALLLVAFVGVPPLARLLGSAWPTPLGWAAALTAIAVVLLADSLYKGLSAIGRAVRPG